MELASCASCGAERPASKMELTGHGLRCVQCQAKAELDRFHGAHSDMAEHLTRGELEQVVRDGGREVVIGIGVAIGGAALTLKWPFYGLAVLFAGFGGSGRGLYRRRHAKRAIATMPDARVVRG
jgi:hypothetical protein